MARVYLKRLELAARQRLPPEAAAEATEDYREMLAEQQAERPEEGPECRWGSPSQAVRLLDRPGQYRRWLIAFGLMAACLVWPACQLVGPEQRPNISACLAVLGAAVSLAWFGWQGKRSEGKPPRAIWALLCCQLLLAGLGAGALYLGAYRWIDLAEAGLLAPEWVGRALGLALTLTGAGSAALGLLGLTLARLADRRWRALYILGLTILALCLLALSVLRSMSLDSSIPGWQRPYLIRAAATALAGFCAAGAGLC